MFASVNIPGQQPSLCSKKLVDLIGRNHSIQIKNQNKELPSLKIKKKKNKNTDVNICRRW